MNTQTDGEFVANGSCLDLKLRYHVWDPYDFVYDDVIGGFFSNRQYRRLHDVGLADEYLITGETPLIEIEWKRGQAREVTRTDVDFSVGGKVKL